MRTGINIKENSSMVCHRAMENIFGQMEPCSKGTLNKALVMGMGFGKVTNKRNKTIKGIIC